MTLLKSLFLGYPGNYRIGDVPISIYRKGDEYQAFLKTLSKAIRKMNESNGTNSDKESPSVDPIQEPSSKLISLNSAAAILSQQYFFTFIHELGHAVAIKILQKDEHPEVTVYLEAPDASFFTLEGKIGGETTGYVENPNPNWKDSVILASGPLSECVVSGVQCVAVATIGRYLPSMLAKSMYLFTIAPFIGRSLNSVLCFDKRSDFSRIKKNSYRDLVIATALVAGNVFVVIALGRKINPEVSF